MYFFSLGWFENHFVDELDPHLFVGMRASGWIETGSRCIIDVDEHPILFEMPPHGDKAQIL